jgi:hypothetical protein
MRAVYTNSFAGEREDVRAVRAAGSLRVAICTGVAA